MGTDICCLWWEARIFWIIVRLGLGSPRSWETTRRNRFLYKHFIGIIILVAHALQLFVSSLTLLIGNMSRAFYTGAITRCYLHCKAWPAHLTSRVSDVGDSGR